MLHRHCRDEYEAGTGAAINGLQLVREFKTEFRFDDKGRIYSKQQGKAPN